MNHLINQAVTAAAAAPRDPEVTRKLRELESAIELSEIAADNLIDRIQPVSRDDPPAMDKNVIVANAVTATQVANTLDTMIRRVEQMGNRLSSAFQRVEL